MKVDTVDSQERVVLVDEYNRPLGTEAKMRAHRAGQLHRALSVFVLNRAGEMLLQRRAASKYHSAGLWSNTCCSHPRPGESPEFAAHRRLTEEMGFDCPLRAVFTFTYRRAFDNGLVEHEYDHVFVGRFDGTPAPASSEVAEWKWVGVDEVVADVAARPERYTAWFGAALEGLLGSGEL